MACFYSAPLAWYLTGVDSSGSTRDLEAGTVVMCAFDLLLHLVVVPGTRRSELWIGSARRVFVIKRRGDRQFAADRLDTQFLGVIADERHHQLPWRSNSACAKYADASRRISLALRNSFTPRSSSFSGSLSLAVCATGPASQERLGFASSRYRRRKVYAGQPILPATEVIAAHSEP